ncbi:MAG: transcriptional repressor [Ignavibacteriales bacterium]|nr:transcriptional repressor [Ignavibacteriales bacterium]
MHAVGTKRSRQREKIYQVLKKTVAHPTAEWVHEQVRSQIPRISLGTVYRNLHILTAQGKIQELDFGQGLHRYDATVDQHYHFVCERCGVVRDLEVPPQQDLHDRVRGVVPGKITNHRLDFFGVCTDCLSKS